ncbi:hypothetical protein EPI10_023165 [Gossypium australe]|uniref:Uncharacterized protein n=1 Tax=Gossypium australe TaxID=47621 RepID=A0A5B6VUM9_9ROSI|nr:hypothetical protein EPI10_023165 [Gossypium australe]
MINMGLIIQDSKDIPKGVRSCCESYTKEGHEIQECTEFRALMSRARSEKMFAPQIKDQWRKFTWSTTQWLLFLDREAIKWEYKLRQES